MSAEDDMITLYGFGRIFPEGHGETKDLWAQWALEETGLPQRTLALSAERLGVSVDAIR
jgi:hypothetical protein